MNLEQTLIKEFSVEASDIDKAREFQKKHGGRLEKLLVNLGSLTEESLIKVYAAYLDVPELQNEQVSVDEKIVSRLNIEDLVAANWLPVNAGIEKIVFITSDPLNIVAVNLIHESNILDYDIQLAPNDVIKSIWQSFRTTENEIGLDGLSDIEEDRLRELASEAPTVNLLNSLITKALKMGASDLHIEPEKERAKVRFRIDGVLQDIETLPQTMKLPIVSRVKILAGMDIAEKRRPQDGKIEARIANKDVDIRVSCLPLGNGESIVMRFLLKESIRYEMSVLGLSSDIQKCILEDLSKTSGVILLTGPTGSGKTTTLYTFLNEINEADIKIITLEDPIEYQLSGVNQVQVNSDIGFDFAAGLRSIVRQDPDVIMVGEIRDNETAKTALQSALTGHLVFSTLHTNDAPSAYTRLLDLGVEEYLLDAALVSVMAQRLVRRLCVHCSISDPNSKDYIQQYHLSEFAKFSDIAEINIRQAKGCDKCSNTGFHGRVAIMEYLRCDDTIKSMPKDSSFIPKVRKYNKSLGRRILLEDGLLKAITGVTTIDEVIRVAG